MAAFTLVAGAIGFTFTWSPAASSLVGTFLTVLTGYTVTMIVSNPATGYRAQFLMTVASGGATASYTTQAATDIPAAGTYSLAFLVTSGATLVLETPAVIFNVAPAL